jgi:hypothetical protein
MKLSLSVYAREVTLSRCYRVLPLPGFRLRRGKEIAPVTMIAALKRSSVVAPDGGEDCDRQRRRLKALLHLGGSGLDAGAPPCPRGRQQ